MTSDEAVRYERRGRVAWLTIDRPEARNALNEAVRKGLWSGFERFEADDEARVLILTGTGEKAFCAGADLKEMAESGMGIPPPDYMPFLGRNVHVTKPVIAAVNGVAFAGGFMLAQMADLCIAADHARFGITEAKWGRGAPWAAPLPWMIGPRQAMELFLLAEPMSASRAAELGFVNRVVASAQLESAALEWADTIAGHAPLSVQAWKKLVYSSLGHDWKSAIDLGDEIYAPVYTSDDAQEGPRAFREGREPNWQGR